MFNKIRTRVRYELGNFRSMGFYEAGRLGIDRAVQRLCLSRLRTAMRPSLHQLHQMSQSTHVSSFGLIEQAFPSVERGRLRSSPVCNHGHEFANRFHNLSFCLVMLRTVHESNRQITIGWSFPRKFACPVVKSTMEIWPWPHPG